MNIAFLSPSLSRTAGGIYEIERSLALSLSKLPDTRLSVYGLEDDFTSEDIAAWEPLRPRLHSIVGNPAFGYSPGLRRDFLSSTADVAHLHALWMYTSYLVSRWSALRKRPYVTTLNGMLDTWALKNSRLKKCVAALLYERRSLQGAGCIQVNSEAELAAARDFGLKGPVCVVPNGVAAPELDAARLAQMEHPLRALAQRGSKVLLYLGRLHPKKGLPNLLEALARLGQNDRDWVLAIAGWDQGGHERELRVRCEALALGERVVFLGPQFGEAKAAAFHYADAFVLPSYSEGLPMSVLEAWSYAKPVLMTPACNLTIGFSEDAAIAIQPNPASIEEGLRRLFALSDEERKAVGRRGRNLALHNFSWATVSRQMRSVYSWLIDGGKPPAWVEL